MPFNHERIKQHNYRLSGILSTICSVIQTTGNPSNALETAILAANFEINLSSSRIDTSETPVNSTPVVNRDLDFEADPPIAIAHHAVTAVLVRERSLLSPTLTTPVPFVKRLEIVEGASVRAI
ncbi:hypothetical protein OUZ56_026587 [Daphnia magna]|uniref:Uncharacterized protein n=1 Tax=Daphnia magna TaxID=35525 RepID=A0ABQ9ZMD0_9CRUS|nr:hypothetical protein OUZ56_026587 [Daphnia magna]